MDNFVFPPRNLPGEADPWGRAHDEQMDQVFKRLETLEQFQQAGNRNVASSLESLGGQIVRLGDVIQGLPSQSFSTSRNEGVSLTNTFVSRASLTVPVPSGKAFAQVLCIGSAAVLDTLTGGVTSSYGRIVIHGDISGEFPASKDAGATQVNNVITASSSREFEVGGLEEFNVALQLRGLNGSAFPSSPSNFAQVSVISLFT